MCAIRNIALLALRSEHGLSLEPQKCRGRGCHMAQPLACQLASREVTNLIAPRARVAADATAVSAADEASSTRAQALTANGRDGLRRNGTSFWLGRLHLVCA